MLLYGSENTNEKKKKPNSNLCPNMAHLNSGRYFSIVGKFQLSLAANASPYLPLLTD